MRGKYNCITVYSHPRSGSHYLTALIAINFFNTENYLPYYGGHGFNFDSTTRKIKRQQNYLFLYIWRDFKDVAKSIFNLRSRFGLDVANFEEFLNTPYSEMWTSNISVKVIRKTLLDNNEIKTADPLFRKLNLLPINVYQNHYNFWRLLEIQYSNIMCIHYGSLLNNFQSTMKQIAKKYQLDKETFLNIKQKIGWMTI